MKAAANDPFADGKPIDDTKEDDGKPKKGAAALVEIVEAAGVEIFTDERSEAYAAIPLPGGSHEVVRLSSARFKSWLGRQLYKDTGTVAGTEAKETAVSLIDAAAKENSGHRALSERFACEGRPAHTIWVDLGDEAWGAVRIQATGWDVMKGEAAPVMFRRGAHVEALPEQPAKDAPLLEELLFTHINVETDGDRLLVLAWVVSTFFSNIPRPILHLAGPKGTAKTTSARVLRRLLDPSRAAILAAPQRAEDLAHQLANHAVPVYDNLSSISGWQSDAFCRAVSGEAWEMRKFYVNLGLESVIVSYQRSLILTGINLSSTAPDLLDRLLLVELGAVKQRRTETSIWSAFEPQWPRLLGALYDLVAMTLAKLGEVEPDPQFRMADFAHVGAAMALAMGKRPEDFSAAYAKTLGAQTTEILEAEPLAVALRSFMADSRNHTAENEWDGRVGELYEKLRPKGPEERHNTFPKSASAMAKKGRVLLHALAEAGLGVAFYNDKTAGKERRVTVRRLVP